MAASYVRRFLSDPGADVLLEIESVNILDLDPPASLVGVGSGAVLVVGEFENGPFATGGNAPQYGADTLVEPGSSTDFVNQLGEVGYRYGGVPGMNPCARARKADGALVNEYWNGNAAIQLNSKKFRRLLCARVDTSVGAVTLSRRASILGAAAFTYDLEPAQVLALDIGAGNVSSTFSAAAAAVTSGAGTYNTGFTGGETLTIGYDLASNFVVTFLAADQTKAQVIARINAYAGFAFASDGGGNLITFTSLMRGTNAQVRIVSGSTGVLAALGLVAATTLGTGNVANIDAVTFREVKTVVEAGMSNNVVVEQDQNGKLRIAKKFAASTDYISVGSATTATALGFTVDQQGSADGIANLRSGAQTMPVTATGVLTLGVDDEANFQVNITNGDSQATIITAINTAAGFTMASSVSATVMLLRGRANAGQVRVVGCTNATLLANLGFTAKTVTNPGVANGTIPAGTIVRKSDNSRIFVTMQDVAVANSNAGPYTVKIRHATDDGTGLSAGAGTIDTIDSQTPIALGSFDCTNPQIVTAALTESAIDALYVLALNATKDLNTVGSAANIVVSARQSNTIRRALRANALDASANGCQGRMALLRTPLGTTAALAKSRIQEPGVGAYRDQRVVFCWPQANTFVPTIALRGLAGGAGFTADGNVDVGAEFFLASVMSQLAPEENPGQETPFAAGANGIETSANAANLQIGDYTSLKAAGICAMRVADGVVIFQSGVTSVDPAVYPNLKNIARRRMADYIQDTLGKRLSSYGKKLSSFMRRKAITTEIKAFLRGLQSPNDPTQQRIDSYSVDDKTANTPDVLAAGRFRVKVKVRTLASLDSIELETTIGESVTVDETALAA